MAPRWRAARAALLGAALLRPLLLLLPAPLRARHGAEMRGLLRERLEHAAARGARALLACWWSELRDLLGTALRLRWRERLAPRAAACLALAAGLTLCLVAIAGAPDRWPPSSRTVASPWLYEEMVVTAVDPAGEFTLTFRRGRLVDATLGGERVPAGRLRQTGRDLAILDAEGRVLLELELELPGTVRWQSRPARES